MPGAIADTTFYLKTTRRYHDVSSRRAHLVRRSRRENLPFLAGALTGFSVGAALGVALLSATLTTNGVAVPTDRATDDTRGGDD